MAARNPTVRVVALALALAGAILVGAGASANPRVATGGTGTGTGSSVGGLRITPTPLDFGVVAKGSTTAKSLTLSNDGAALVTINAPLGKPNTPDCNAFTVAPSPPLPEALFPTDTATWTVTFKPSLFGPYDCQWNLNTSDALTHTVHLVGSVPPPNMKVTPSPVAFGNVAQNATVDQTVTISNSGSGDLVVSGITLTSGNPPFSIKFLPTLPATVPPTGSTTFTAEFHPTATGSFNGTVVIASNDPLNTTANLSLSGSGVGTGGAIIDLAPDPVDFGDILVGQTTASSLGVGNTGTAGLQVTAMSIAGANATDFHFADASLGCTSGQTCNTLFIVGSASPARMVGLACTPSAAGLRFATLTVTSNAQSGTSTVTLQCTGDSPQISVSPPSIDYGTVRVGAVAHANLTISNFGTADLVVSSIPIDGANPSDFALGSCATGCTIPATTASVIDVTFTPPARGARSATLHVHSNDLTDPIVDVPLSGAGGAGVMVITTPANGMINFGSIPVNQTSSSSPITIANQGELDLTINTLSLSPSQFAMTGATAPVVIGAGTSQTWNVTCKPTSAILFNGTFSASSDAPTNGDQSVSLMCTGITSNLVANPAPVSFGVVRTDMVPATKTVTVTNTGALAVTINSLGAAPPGYAFVVQGTALPRTLNMNDQLLIDIKFTPTTTMTYTGDLTLVDSTGGTAADVQLSGDGVVPAFTVAPTMIDYGSMCVGQADTHDVLIMNTGTAHFQVSGTHITGGGGAFSISNGDVGAGIDLAPQQGHTVTVLGRAASGTSNGSLDVTTDLVTGGSASVSLGIMGTLSGLASDPAMLDFGTHAIGAPVPPMDVTIINCSAAAVMVTGASLAGTDQLAFAQSGPQTGTMLVGGGLTYTVSFSAQHAGAHTAQLVVTTNGGQVMVPLGGTGAAPGGDGGIDAMPGVDGGNSLDSTSYYACSCRSSASPGAGAPILFALAFALRRRRRRR